MIADKVIGLLGANPSPYLLTFVVFMLCCVLTNFMSNTATTALMVPICVSIANRMGADPSAVLMACVIGGSCAYATPIGMPANTMVVTAGGYTFKDYAKAGIPLILVATVVSIDVYKRQGLRSPTSVLQSPFRITTSRRTRIRTVNSTVRSGVRRVTAVWKI